MKVKSTKQLVRSRKPMLMKTAAMQTQINRNEYISALCVTKCFLSPKASYVIPTHTRILPSTHYHAASARNDLSSSETFGFTVSGIINVNHQSRDDMLSTEHSLLGLRRRGRLLQLGKRLRLPRLHVSAAKEMMCVKPPGC